MKAKIKVRDLIDMLIFNKYDEIPEKYDIDQRRLGQIRQALTNGKWKVAVDLMDD